MKLHLFNPENDLALADGNSNYCPPPAARAIAHDLSSLPLWFADADDCVLLPSDFNVGYVADMSRYFTLPRAVVSAPLQQISAVVPWGWSAQMRRRFSAMGVDDSLLPKPACIEQLRACSNRRTAIDILAKMRFAGIDTPEIPLYISFPSDVAAFINSMPRSVIKAPWSGSGKGIAWGIGRVEVPVEHFYQGVIRRQGGVVCERFLDKVVDFAMEFSVSGGMVSFAGYSLFTCDGGAYSGNILATDAVIEDFLQGYIKRDVLAQVRDFLVAELANVLAPVSYDGYLGVDMLIYRTKEGFRLNPCVEINLRMNMGAVSRIFFDKFVSGKSQGRFSVTYYKEQGAALAGHLSMQQQYPLSVERGRVVSGYLPLSPVTADSRYSAFVVLSDSCEPISRLYFNK